MDLRIILNNLFNQNKHVTLKEFYWRSDIFFLHLLDDSEQITINGIKNDLTEDYYPILFNHNEYLSINKEMYSSILKNTYDIVNYILFVNNILLFPNDRKYYKKGLNSIIGVNNISELRKTSFCPEYGTIYDVGHYANRNGTLENCMIVNLMFHDLSINLYVLKDIFKVSINKYYPIEHNLITYTYNIKDLYNFENDYRTAIFKMYIQKDLDIKMNNFNFHYYKLNKILKLND